MTPGGRMRKSKFSETQIIAILKAVEAGKTVRDVCREHKSVTQPITSLGGQARDGRREVLVGRVLQFDEKTFIRMELVDVENGWQVGGEEYNEKNF